jgi:hypothetical protein
MRLKLLVIFIFIASITYSQKARLDWKIHNAGKVLQLVTNMGTLWRTETNYRGLIYCEYPPGSGEEHIGEGGIWIGGITPEGDTLVSVTTGWGSFFEFYPTANNWDTIWVVGRNQVANIPYWPYYIGVSDQDFVCKYSDYNVLNIPNHKPMYLDVIQVSYAWSTPPIDEIIFYHFYIIPTKFNLRQVFIAYWLDGNVGLRLPGWDFAVDDYSVYFPDQHLGIAIDYPGGVDGNAYGPIGVKVYPPENINKDSLKWTWIWSFVLTPRDVDRYNLMASGQIMQNQHIPNGSQFFIAFGPLTLNVGDTLHFMVAEILGKGLDGMLSNVKTADWLVQRNFKIPSPPPPPPLRIVTDNHKVILRWKPQPGDVNPETYTDPYRADGETKPFEGYRVYKSTQSINGPWTLLAEFDVPDDRFGYNTGLAHEFVDEGLLNNFEYFYSVTSFSKPDTVAGFPALESSVNANAKKAVPGTAPPQTVGKVAVVPNPYRGDVAYYSYNPPWEKPAPGRKWMEQDRKIQFINLPPECIIRVYTVSGELVTTIYHSDPNKGYEDWNLTSSVGQAVSSGIYLFSVEDLKTGNVQVGKFVIIK